MRRGATSGNNIARSYRYGNSNGSDGNNKGGNRQGYKIV